MADTSQGPPTYYANFVTSMINVDELTMEFRRLIVPHKDFWAGDLSVVEVPPLAPAKLAETEPIARVVITFTAVKALKDYLDQVMPKIEKSRTTGEPIKF